MALVPDLQIKTPQRIETGAKITEPCLWHSCPQMPRLDTLAIFINETKIRRPWEADNVKQYQQEITEGQPNARMSRSVIFGVRALKKRH